MNPAFLVFDLVVGTPVLSASAIPDVSSSQNLMTLKKRAGLSSETRVSRVRAAKASPNSTGRIRVILQPDVSYVVARFTVRQSKIRGEIAPVGYVPIGGNNSNGRRGKGAG